MPRAEERALPKGQSYGAAGEQQGFIDQASQPSEQPGVGSVVATPMSPVAQPVLPTQQQEVFKPPAEEVAPPNVLENGMNLDEIIFGPTQRPMEPVNAGLPGVTLTPPRVSEVLQGLIDTNGPSPDIMALLRHARNAGL